MDNSQIVLLLAGFITGISKFSTGGMGFIILALTLTVFPSTEAIVVLLPMYLMGDIMVVSSYRANISWPALKQLLPLAALGILLGSFLLSYIDTNTFNKLLGIIILMTLSLGAYLEWKKISFMQTPKVLRTMAFSSGVISILANAAGPIISLYLLEQKLSKKSYLTTRSWIFLIINIINIIKIIIVASLGILNWPLAKQSLITLPALFVGAGIGYLLLKQLNLKQFKSVIQGVTSIAAIKLIFF